MELQENLQQIQDTGTVLYSISPDAPDKLESFRQQNGFEFTMLVDGDLEVTKRLGLLNESSGKIPHPTALIIDQQGVTSYLRIDVDYRVRPPTVDELIPALEAAGS